MSNIIILSFWIFLSLMILLFIISCVSLYIIEVQCKYLWAAKLYAMFFDRKIWDDYIKLKSINKAIDIDFDSYIKLLTDKQLDSNTAYHFSGAFWIPILDNPNKHDELLLQNDDICYPLYREQYMRFFGEEPKVN